jgi:hypothetical protein
MALIKMNRPEGGYILSLETKQRECWKEGVLAVVFCFLIREYTVNLPTFLWFLAAGCRLSGKIKRKEEDEII